MVKQYVLVSNEQRQMLIELIHKHGHSISRAAKSVGIYYPTAKAINKVYVREHRIQKKTFRSTIQSFDAQPLDFEIKSLSPQDIHIENLDSEIKTGHSAIKELKIKGSSQSSNTLISCKLNWCKILIKLLQRAHKFWLKYLRKIHSHPTVQPAINLSQKRSLSQLRSQSVNSVPTTFRQLRTKLRTEFLNLTHPRSEYPKLVRDFYPYPTFVCPQTNSKSRFSRTMKRLLSALVCQATEVAVSTPLRRDWPQNPFELVQNEALKLTRPI